MKLKLSTLLTIALAFVLTACGNATTSVPTLAPSAEPPDDMTPIPFPNETEVLSWRREGGIAGFCDALTVFANGDFTVANCMGQPPVRNGELNDQQMAQFTNWVKTFESFEDGPDDTTVTFPDQMFVKTIFKGAGTTQAGPDDIAAISEFASLLVAETPPTQPTDTSGHPEAATKARDFLAAELGISSSEITIVSVEAVEWSDSCLGLGGAEEMCAAMITPGYRVILEAQGKEYDLHTDESGDNIRRVP